MPNRAKAIEQAALEWNNTHTWISIRSDSGDMRRKHGIEVNRGNKHTKTTANKQTSHAPNKPKI